MIKVTFPDGSIREYKKGIKVVDVAKDISEGLARVVLAAEVNGKAVDLNYEIYDDSSFSLEKFQDDLCKDIF